MSKGSFQIVPEDPSLETIKRIDEWVDKWETKGLSDKWIKYINSSEDVHPGVNYPLIQNP